MCFSSPSIGSTDALTEQLNKNNVLLSNEKVASKTGEKEGKKRTVSSLRIPLKKTTDVSSTGANTSDTTTGLNIPI